MLLEELQYGEGERRTDCACVDGVLLALEITTNYESDGAVEKS